MKKPLLPTSSIWNMSIGFLGIQAGFALQNANASRILQSFGADTHHLSWFWLVAPITGMIVQPLIGHYSDRTWTKLGRRKPYFLVGAICAAVGLILMPNASLFTAFIPALWVGAGMLMIMDASFNVAMEPFRALVADKLSTDQRTAGFAIQTVLIGIGAVLGSWLPYILGRWFGVSTEAEAGTIPMNVIVSFVIGAALLVGAILWTVITTPEYSPEEMAGFEDAEPDTEHSGAGTVVGQIFRDFGAMPETMRQLGLVQFCTWFALFGMWVFTTPAIATHIYGVASDDTSSATFQEAGNWVGIIFGVYNGISAIYAFALPYIARKIGRKKTHAVSLVAGSIGLISIYFVKDPNVLLFSMVGVGIAWASILAMPYAMLAGSLPAKKMGIYMGIFNFFITFPQIVNGVFGGPLVKYLYGNQAIYALVTSGIFMLLGAVAVLFVKDRDDVVAGVA